MRVLPARFARLPRDFAIIFVRESFLAPATTIATARASAVATISAAPAATTRTTRAAAGFGFGPSFIYFQVTSANIFAVEGCDCFGRFGVVGHFHESEAACATGFAVGGHVHTRELAEGLKQRTKIFRCGLKAHVAYEQIFHCDSPPSKPQPSHRQKTSARLEQKLLSCSERKMDRAVPGRQTRSSRRANTANLLERILYSITIGARCLGDAVTRRIV